MIQPVAVSRTCKFWTQPFHLLLALAHLQGVIRKDSGQHIIQKKGENLSLTTFCPAFASSRSFSRSRACCSNPSCLSSWLSSWLRAGLRSDCRNCGSSSVVGWLLWRTSSRGTSSSSTPGLSSWSRSSRLRGSGRLKRWSMKPGLSTQYLPQGEIFSTVIGRLREELLCGSWEGGVAGRLLWDRTFFNGQTFTNGQTGTFNG